MMHLDDHEWSLTLLGVYGCLRPDISRLGAEDLASYRKYLNKQPIRKHSLVLELCLKNELGVPIAIVS